MKVLLTCFIAIMMASPISTQRGVPDIGAMLKQDNSRELGKLFSSSIELTLPADDNLYTKDQAESALDKFLKAHKAKGVTALHKIDSSSSFLFEVYILSTDKGAFRVACTLKNTLGDYTVIEIRIEQVKDR